MALADAFAAWQEYFVVAAGVAAVLLGLVFVGESIQGERRSRAGRRWVLAWSSATALFYALLTSLVMVIPEGRPVAQGGLLIAIGVGGVVSASGALATAQASGWSGPSRVFRFGLPLAAMVALALSGAGLVVAWEPAIWLTAGAALTHIAIGTQNGWDLLLGPPAEPPR